MSVLRCKSNLVGGWVCGPHDITRGRFLRLRVLAHTLWKLDTIRISIGWLFLGSWLAFQKCVWSKFMDTSYIQTADAPTFKDSHIAGQKVYIEIEIKNNHCDASSHISCLFSFQLFTFSCLRITKMNLTCTQQTPEKQSLKPHVSGNQSCSPVRWWNKRVLLKLSDRFWHVCLIDLDFSHELMMQQGVIGAVVSFISIHCNFLKK